MLALYCIVYNGEPHSGCKSDSLQGKLDSYLYGRGGEGYYGGCAGLALIAISTICYQTNQCTCMWLYMVAMGSFTFGYWRLLFSLYDIAM